MVEAGKRGHFMPCFVPSPFNALDEMHIAQKKDKESLLEEEEERGPKSSFLPFFSPAVEITQFGRRKLFFAASVLFSFLDPKCLCLGKNRVFGSHMQRYSRPHKCGLLPKTFWSLLFGDILPSSFKK